MIMSGEADKLFDKKYTCPVCENNFTSKTVRSGKQEWFEQIWIYEMSMMGLNL